MTPTTVTSTVSQIITNDQLPSKTYAIDWDNGQITGYIDGLDAVMQSIEKILRTDRFTYLIYSWQYGMEWNQSDLTAGNVTALQTAITDALSQDSRVLSVSDLAVEAVGRNGLHLSFTISTNYGTTTQEVTTYV